MEWLDKLGGMYLIESPEGHVITAAHIQHQLEMLIIQTNQVIIANITEYHSYRERPEYRIIHNGTGYGGPVRTLK